jgi:hypothetical protein
VPWAALAVVGMLGAPAAAAETGTIEGRVVNATTGRPQGGVAVTLTGGRRGELTRDTTTDARGRYRFAGLPAGEERFYALDARYEGGLFAGRAVALPSDTAQPPVIDGTLRVWETTTDPGAILIRRDDLFVVPGEAGGVGVIESVTVANTSERAYIGRGGGRDGGSGAPPPSVAFSLPADAAMEGLRILEATIDVPEIVALEGLGGFGTTVAIPPGDPVRITFTYRVEGTAGRFDLSRRALYPVLEHSVFTREPLSLESDRLASDGRERLSGETYLRWSSEEPLDAGDTVAAVAVAEAGLDPLLTGAAAAALLLVAALAAVALLRARRSRPVAGLPSDGSRADLLVAIAELDLRYRDGEMAREEWSLQRAKLKDRLARPSA